MHLAKELILKKRDGIPLSAEEIDAFVEGVTNHTVSDAQIAAFAMAIWFRGMDLEEKITLTLAMRDSGEVLNWPDLDGPVLDKHSTGGVGDLVSLILGPLIAACGAYVPMISGRGLGHTGGTLDKLESIPGFNTRPGIRQFQQLVRNQRVAIIGQSSELVPADQRFYAVRDVTATVSSVPLIVSSILSKKLAEGLDGLVMDIKFGSGAFMKGPEEARELATEIAQVAHIAGLPCNALITGMDQPLAWSAGNALEVHEAIRFLRGDACHVRLRSVVLALSSELLKLGGLAQDDEASHEMAVAALESGGAAEQFAKMVKGQGGPADLLEKPGDILPTAVVVRPVFSNARGYISEIDTKQMGNIVVQLGGGRQKSEDIIDPAVGIADISDVGQAVGPDTPLAVIHAGNESDWALAAAKLGAAIRIAPEQSESPPVIFGRVEGGQVDASAKR